MLDKILTDTETPDALKATVKYDRNGHGSAPSNQEVVIGTKIPLPNMNNDGYYTFLNWTAGGQTYDAGTEYTVTENVTFTANWRNDTPYIPPVVPTDTETTTTTNPDGSTTTTVVNKTAGTVTETTRYPDGSSLVVVTESDGTVTTTETTVEKVVVKTVDEPGRNVTATVTIPAGIGTATVTIPADVTPGTVAVYAKTGEVVMLSIPTEDGVRVKLDGSAELVLRDNSARFIDVTRHWAKDAVDFVSAHELFNGTGEAIFSPDAPMTRAMLMTVLARFEGVDTAGGSVWYEKGMNWAMANGISDGTNPGNNITREQMAAMLYRYVGSPAVTGSLDRFPDGDKVSPYAVDAMRWAVSIGLFSGNDAGMLNPQHDATRAEVATILMRFCAYIVK